MTRPTGQERRNWKKRVVRKHVANGLPVPTDWDAYWDALYEPTKQAGDNSALQKELDDVSRIAMRRWRVLLNIRAKLRSCCLEDPDCNRLILECLQLIRVEEDK